MPLVAFRLRYMYNSTPILLLSSGLTQALQLLAGLSLLVALHEFGHFFFARLFKTRVEKFYLFFDFLFPFSSVLNFALFKKKVGDTEYGLGWFPLGGYVKISGMIDESMDKEAMKLPPEPWEYRSKKAWQRLLIMLGGILMNVIVAIIIHVIILAAWGERYLPNANVRYGISADSSAQYIGLRSGDKIIAIDDKPIVRFNDITLALLFHKEKGTIKINRDGKDTLIAIPDGTINKLLKAKKGRMIGVRTPLVIDTVLPGTVAYKAGMQKDDSLIAIDNHPAGFYDQFIDYKREHAGQPMVLTFMRNNAPVSVTVTVAKDSMLGFVNKQYDYFLSNVHLTYNPIAAIGRGFTYTIERCVLYVAQFKLLGSKEVKIHENLGGIYSMGKLYGENFDWEAFLAITAFISIALAIVNLLPIPGLDGGYVIFLLFEMATGRKVSEKVIEAATTVGLVILLALMVMSNGLDVLRIFHIKI